MNQKSRIAVTALLLMIGLSALGYGGVVLNNTPVTKWGQDSYWLQISVESPTEAVPGNASVLSYSELSVDGQRAFDNALNDQQHTLWSGDDSAVIDTLNEHDYIQYRGEYFEYGLGHGHMGWGSIGAILLLTFTVGGVLTVAGLARIRRHLSER